MPLYDITQMRDGAGSGLSTVAQTSFAAEGIQERAHLQAALRDHIDVISRDLFVISEEFGDFESVNRRIDLLCLDRECRLVVVELKRTADGGHMELQALRYAAMVSTMTFPQVVTSLAKYRKSRGIVGATEEAVREELLAFIDEDLDEPTISRNVGIVLASEDFSQEITTTVLWLNEFHDFDIRCVRLTPYRLGERLLLDAQQVIPLPEASAYTVRVRAKEVAEKKSQSGGSDWTKFVVTTATGELSAPLAKRWAILEAVRTLASIGIDMRAVADALPPSKSFDVDGIFTDEDELWAEAQRVHGKPDPKRWHLSHPIVADGRTWVIHANWGRDTRDTFARLKELAPDLLDVFEEHEAPST